MGMLDAFPSAEPEEPWDDLSLAEEAALHSPALWSPAQGEPEGLTPLPEDFPVEDPFDRLRESSRRIIGFLERKAVCRIEDCALDDRETLAEEAAELYVEGVNNIKVAAIALYAHGERMVAELMIDAMVCLSEDVFKPFLESAGIESEIGGDEDD